MTPGNEQGRVHAAERGVVFKLNLEGKPPEGIEVVAHLFDANGARLASAALRDGEAKFDMAEDALRRARLLFAPVLPEARFGKTVTMAKLQRTGAYEPVWRYMRNQRSYDLLPVPEVVWRWWRWCSCRVRGRVIKPVSAGRVAFDVPVCNARVHVCEVDRLSLLIPQLPDAIVWRLRDELLRVIEGPLQPLPPEPDPWELVDPGRRDPTERYAEALAAAQRVIGGPTARRGAGLPLMRGEVHLRRGHLGELSPQPEPPDRPSAASLAPAEHAALASGSIMAVRKALAAQAALLRPWICHWPWLWQFVHRYDEVATVDTDARGRFDTRIWYPCAGDRPDLYFWVEYLVDGSWQPVYQPHVACHTYWDFECDSEVTLKVADSRVPGCWDRPVVHGKKLVVKSIGHDVSMGDINRDIHGEAALLGTGKAGELAHEDYPEWATKAVAFGGMLEPRVDFGDELAEAGITHYRWSYRALDAAPDDPWTPIRARVARHYRKRGLRLNPVEYGVVEVGPDADGLFLIDPLLPTDGEDWEVLSEHFDLASAHFDTCTPEVWAGRFVLKLELFRKRGDSAERVDLTAERIELYETVDRAPFIADVIHTAVPTNDRIYRGDLAPEGGNVLGYRLVLHIDNRPCFGVIDDVTVAGVGAGPCGFIEYEPGATATLSFEAGQPGNFGAFVFLTTRAKTRLRSASAHGLVGDDEVRGFTATGDTFSKVVPVATLLEEDLPAGSPPCRRAAFAETLHVHALVTDGYQRLWRLDAAHQRGQTLVRAFALTPRAEAT